MTTDSEPIPTARSRLAGLFFGLAFGFLLQKGGVADYDVLIGALRLLDPTVFIVILTAILVGGLATAVAKRLGLARPHPKPTQYGGNVVGGLIFGLGFGLLGYCPGTGAAALGQGSWDAGYGLIGLIAGSFAYALLAPALKKLEAIGEHGKLLVPTLLRMAPGTYLVAVSLLMGLLILVLYRVPR